MKQVCAFPSHVATAEKTDAQTEARRLASLCFDIQLHQTLLRDATEEAYRLLLKGVAFPEESSHYTTLEMLRWPEVKRVIARYAGQAPRGESALLLCDIEQRHIRERTIEMKQAAKNLRHSSADRFVDEYLKPNRQRVWRRFTDDLSDRIYHQRWDFLDCFRLLGRSEWQIGVLGACAVAYRMGFSVEALAAKAVCRLEAGHRGQVVPLSRDRGHRSDARPA